MICIRCGRVTRTVRKLLGKNASLFQWSIILRFPRFIVRETDLMSNGKIVRRSKKRKWQLSSRVKYIILQIANQKQQIFAGLLIMLNGLKIQLKHAKMSQSWCQIKLGSIKRNVSFQTQEKVISLEVTAFWYHKWENSDFHTYWIILLTNFFIFYNPCHLPRNTNYPN